jgi:hypothetical protein
MTTLPDFETDLLERYYQIFLEIPSAGGDTLKAFRNPPVHQLGDAELPCIYPLIGEMRDFYPSVGLGTGVVEIQRDSTWRLLGSPLQSVNELDKETGAQAFVNINLYFAIVREYLFNHPRLETSTQNAFGYLVQSIQYRDSGIVIRQAPSGIDHFAIDWTIRVTLQTIV